MQFERCPKAMLAEDLAFEADLASDALVFREHGLAPDVGGLLDQSAQWVEALSIVDSELARLKVPHGG